MSHRLETSVWNPIEKKVCRMSLLMDKDDNEEEKRAELRAMVEERKAMYRKQKAELILNKQRVADKSNFEVTPLKLDLDHSTGNVIGFIGSTRSGKTYLMKHIYDNYFKDEGYITTLFACNKHADIYKSIDRRVIQTYDFIPEIPKIQHRIQRKTKNKYKFLNWLDDQVDNSTKNSQILKKMMVSYRNAKMSCLLSFQYASMLTKTNRSNLHTIILMRMNTDEAIEDIIRKFLNSYLGGRGVTMDEKIRKYREFTSNYGFIVIDNITGEIKRNVVG